jgi:acetylornithine deacetylase
MSVKRGDAVALTRELVRIDSRNPSLVPGAPGESAAAGLLCDVLTDWGGRVSLQPVENGRANVIARFGAGGGRSLLFNGHLDVVGVEAMVHEPWSAEQRGGRIYGRGSSDMKAGIAAMCAAAARAGGELAGEVILTAVVDEEYASIGTRALVASGIRADAAIVTEPTRLAIMPAHKGFAWFEIEVHGRAAHGSRWELGVDAIALMGRVLGELDRFNEGELARRTHALLGRASMHASTIEGGVGMSTYPERCTLRVERRTLPGEHPEQVRAEIADCCRRALGEPGARWDSHMFLSAPPSDVATDAPVVRALAAASRDAGVPPVIEGMSAWTDAALLNEAGIPAVCFGPGDISLAHAAEEFVEMDEIERATDILTRLARSWCADGEPT